jgi:hypothetical protein
MDSDNPRLRFFRIRIKNDTVSPITNCQVKLIEFGPNNNNAYIPISLKLKYDNCSPIDLSHDFKKSFDLPNEGEEYIDVALLEESNSNSQIILTYATSPGEHFMDKGKVIRTDRLNPYRLKIRATANQGSKVEETFLLFVEDSKLQMEML